jgi:FixJ family two-component response regulator
MMDKLKDSSQETLFAVDDDPKARKALAALTSSLGIRCELFSSAEEFLDYYNPSLAGCVLADVRLKGINGLELQDHLAALGSVLPVILIGAYADVSLAVRGMQNVAMAIIEKPYQDDELTDAIRTAFDLNASARESLTVQVDVQRCLEALTQRERRLMELVVTGVPNKRIANILGISQRTVDRVRAMVFEKMHVESAVELAQVTAEFRRLRPAEEQRFLQNCIASATEDNSAAGAGNNNHLTERIFDLWRRDQQSIAHEIDDGIAQYLTEAAMNLKQYERLREEKTANAGMALDKAVALLKRSIDEVRLLIRDLQPAITDEGGFVTALEDLIWEYRTETEIEFLHEVSSKRFDPFLESTVYGIMQKSLSDACRHGQSRMIQVNAVQQDDRLSIDIRVWAVGSNPTDVGKRKFGWHEIQEWASLLRGRVSVKTTPGQSTHVSIEFPLTESPLNSPSNGVAGAYRESF